MSEGPSDNSTGGPGGSRVIADVVLYATARLLLVVVLSAAIYGAARLLGVNEFPIVVAALFALIIAMPLGIWLFSPLRRRATAALAVSRRTPASGTRTIAGPAARRGPTRRDARAGVRSA